MLIIYIPICFYYFGVGEYVRSRVYNLHSNMFLLFHILFQKSNPCDVIYIPICFYYFFSSKIFNKMERRIYIPICFYYFLFLGSPVLLSTRFTFQYVSIISKDWVEYLKGQCNLHSNMFLLFLVSLLIPMRILIHLHSNMFLLFPVQCSPL